MCSSMEGMKSIPPLCSLFSVHVLQEGSLEIIQDKLSSVLKIAVRFYVLFRPGRSLWASYPPPGSELKVPPQS